MSDTNTPAPEPNTTPLTDAQLQAVTSVLLAESEGAWEAGLNNCAGPITPERARALIISALNNA